MRFLSRRWLAAVAVLMLLQTEGQTQETVRIGEEIRPLPVVEPTEPEELQAAIERGVQFLIDDQNPNGSWGSPTKTKGLNIYAPVPGAHHAFRAGTTSLALSGLLEVAPDDPKTQSTIDRAEAWL